jgi:hypothetical protein
MMPLLILRILHGDDEAAFELVLLAFLIVGIGLIVMAVRAINAMNARKLTAMRFSCPGCSISLPAQRVKHCSTCGMAVTY